MVSALIEAHPGQIGAMGMDAPLCATLPAGITRQRCEQLSLRPHLQLRAPRPKPGQLRPAGGPASNDIAPSVPATSRLADTPPAAHGCEEAADRTGCLLQSALEAEDVVASVGRCVSITDPTWRGECLFQAAEARLQSDPTAYLDAASLCAMATPFVQECNHHLIVQLAALAPPVGGDWSAVLDAETLLQQTWAERDAYMAEITVDRLWSEAVGNAIAQTPTVDGALLSDLPAHTHRHVRAAVVAALIAEDGAAARDLSGWVSHAAAVLSGEERALSEEARTFVRATERWPQDGPQDGSFAATFYLGTARRVWSEEDRVDLTLCVLEAAARRSDGAALLAQGYTSSEPDVLQTVRRLSIPGPQGAQ